MKYWFGAVCILIGAWLVYRTLAHRRAVLRARERAGTEQREREISRQLQGLQAMRTGLAPLFVLLILLGGMVLTGLWFVLDRSRVLSALDIFGFLAAISAYAFSIVVRLQYSTLGLDMSPAD
jgi:hypothetical protein